MSTVEMKFPMKPKTILHLSPRITKFVKIFKKTNINKENNGNLKISQRKECLSQSEVKNNKEQRPIISCFNTEIFEKLKYVEC